MKNKRLIIIVACSLMIVAYFTIPVIASIKVTVMGISQSTKYSIYMFRALTSNNTSFWFFLIYFLLLLAPIYLLMDVYRKKIQEKISVMAKIVIPEKVAMLLPLILIILLALSISNTIGSNASVVYGIGFYLYLLAAIVLAILPWVNNPLLENGKDTNCENL